MVEGAISLQQRLQRGRGLNLVSPITENYDQEQIVKRGFLSLAVKKKKTFFLSSHKPKDFTSNKKKEIGGGKCGMCLIILIAWNQSRKTLTC